jgi:hypothetical protein
VVSGKLVVPGEAAVVVCKLVSVILVVPGETDVEAAVVSEEADAVVCEVLSGKLGTQQVLK